MTFKIGIEVERVSTSLMIVECEADSLKEAQAIALKGAMKRARDARSWRDLFPNSGAWDIEWQDSGFGVNCVSDEISQDQMEHYSADFSVAR